ncbi:Endonuclease-reverse transcriptase [Popillia japonica]|uniref:Endonuclease-reverse transcriptase n=1 Tax=Popillia japonica TaxID=7064 RepID=A0AAW1HTG7_POPJA
MSPELSLSSKTCYDVIGVTETWLTPGVVDEAVALDGYALVRLDRDDGRRGGGVALYIKNKFAYTRLTVTKVYAGFEYLLVRITVNGIGVTVGVVYRPPSSDTTLFIESFENLLSDIIVDTDEIVILGDFNINLLDLHNKHCSLFHNMCDTLGIKQIINDPTRESASSSSLIDLILLFSRLDVHACGVKHELTISDHFLTYVQLKLSLPVHRPHYHTFRDFYNFDSDSFAVDLQSLPWHYIYFAHDINEKLFFNAFLMELFDTHAPFKTVCFRSLAHSTYLKSPFVVVAFCRSVAIARTKLQNTED